MPTTMKLIAKVEAPSGGSASVEFTSIPDTYTDLLILISARSTSATSTNRYTPLAYNFNGATSGYSVRRLIGTGSAASSNTATTLTIGGVVYGRITDYGITSSQATANTFAQFEMYVPNYAGATNKSWSSTLAHENNETGAYIEAAAGLWSNTSAITSVKFITDPGSFAQYSTVYLYGITKS